MKRLCLLGATGSIGKNCLDIVERFPEKFSIRSISAYSNVQALYALAQRVKPVTAALSQSHIAAGWERKFRDLGVEFLAGENAPEEIASRGDYDVLVNAIVGAAGLRPTVQAIENGKNVALANKETLVIAGELVMRLAREKGVQVIPIDSEHSALWQCLVGEDRQRIERLIITASGGPFRELPQAEFDQVTVEQALDHPNWKMGQKITIDSATLMNKGLEVIEAYWLFDVPVEKISVLIHPQSIIHSMVEFVDGSIKAQLGLPDMRLPIQYALAYPERLPNDLPRMDFKRISTLSFFEPDFDKFRALGLAFEALKAAGTAPAVLNAANEEAVYAFLDSRISFDRIPQMVESALAQHTNRAITGLQTILAADRWARGFVKEKITGG